MRIGNDAATRFQLDVYGEVVMALHHSRAAGLVSDPEGATWRLQRAMVEYLESVWHQPDQGLWEFRREPTHNVHSKVLAWAAFDRAVADAEGLGIDAPTTRWRRIRDAIHADVMAKGFDADRNTFTRAYGTSDLDGALLRLPLSGFLPWDDSHIVGTISAIQRQLADERGLVRRYAVDDGLPGKQGAFLACSFWLVQCLAHIGRRDEASQMFDRLLDLTNDIGLLSEEYDGAGQRMVGNFPQAFSHVALVITALALDHDAQLAKTHRTIGD